MTYLIEITTLGNLWALWELFGGCARARVRAHARMRAHTRKLSSQNRFKFPSIYNSNTYALRIPPNKLSRSSQASSHEWRGEIPQAKSFVTLSIDDEQQWRGQIAHAKSFVTRSVDDERPSSAQSAPRFGSFPIQNICGRQTRGSSLVNPSENKVDAVDAVDVIRMDPPISQLADRTRMSGRGWEHRPLLGICAPCPPAYATRDERRGTHYAAK